MPSFVIDALPAEAFEALLVVTSWIGEVLVDEPPYLLEVHLHDPAPCWCRLELVPDAGSSTVSLTVAGRRGRTSRRRSRWSATRGWPSSTGSDAIRGAPSGTALRGGRQA